ncbi:hypothetical protein ABW19_dt0202102 [Dactylella cylindrospora]|nr:hypothetical protein ABW19_dt0202102 [Dactylella cylindrospora]
MEEQKIVFSSFGMIVLDDIYFGDDWVNPIYDSLGGSGTYSTLGARLFCPGLKSSSIGWVMRIGRGFPDATLDRLKSWGTTAYITEESCGPARGHLRYEDTTLGPKSFKYSSPPLWILPSHFENTTSLSSTTFHFLGPPSDIFRDVPKLLALREQAGVTNRPTIIWEPRPATCTPKFLGAYQKALKLVDVFSPNHMELAGFFDMDSEKGEKTGKFNQTECEAVAKTFLRKGIGANGDGCLVLRAGEYGCMILTPSMETPVWLPAFYKGGDKKIVDTTGAGNSFLGGFAIGLTEVGDYVEAAKYGTVASSFVVEQMGVPDLAVGDDGMETWNGENVRERLDAYRAG